MFLRYTRMSQGNRQVFYRTISYSWHMAFDSWRPDPVKRLVGRDGYCRIVAEWQ